MTVVASSLTRRAAIALAAGAVLVLPACGAGQISQTARQVATVSGAHAQSGPLALRDVRVVLPADSAVPGKAARAALAFSVINTSPSVPDQLRQIEVSGAAATIQPSSPDLKAGQIVMAITLAENEHHAGKSATEQRAPESSGGDVPPAARPLLVELTDLTTAVAPGLNVRVTFTFAKAAAVTFEVPVELEQAVPDKPAPPAKSGHH